MNNDSALVDLLQDKYYSDTVKYTSAGVAVCLIILGLGGNGVIVVSSIKYKAFQLHKVTATLIKHLAVSDMACTVVMMIPSTIATLTDTWPFGYRFCQAHFYLLLTLSHISVLQIGALTTSKLVSLQCPLRARMWGPRTGHVLGTSVWVISSIPALVLLSVDPNRIYYDNIRIACMYDFSDPLWRFLLPTLSFFMAVLPNLLVVFSTIGLIFSAWRVAKRNRESLKWQGILAVILVAVVYCISFSPQIVFNFLGNKYLHPEDTKTKVGLFVCGRLTLLNYVSNVFIYAVSVRSFQQFLTGLWTSFSTRMTDLGSGRVVESRM